MARLPLKMPLAAVDGNMALGCAGCWFRDACGGLYVQEPVWDCFSSCGAGCTGGQCDYTCLHRPDFVSRWREVGGLPGRPVKPLRELTGSPLPLYVPMVRHGKKREGRLDVPVAAVSTFDLLRLRDGRYGPVAGTAEDLRARFRLAMGTRILLVSVAKDRFLEQFWRYRTDQDVAAQLAELDVIGMTTPNYSFFLDAPRTHTLWNRERLLRVAEELSAKGVAVVPHLQATFPADWEHWYRMLKEQSQMVHVCKEFCTGLTRLPSGRGAIEQLAKLQDRLGRDLHPIVIGGARYIPDLAASFGAFTVVDSTPFLRTVKRRALVARPGKRPGWVQRPTAPGEPLDSLLAENVAAHGERLAKMRRSPEAQLRPEIRQAAAGESSAPLSRQLALPGIV